MKTLMLWSLRNAKLVIIINVLVTILFGYYALQVRVDSSTEGMMIEGDPAKEIHRDTVKRFGSDNITVVFIRDKGLFTPEKLAQVEKLYNDLKDIPGVGRCESLFSVTNFKGVDGAIETNPLLDQPPATLAEAKRIQADALNNPLFMNSLISKDGQMTAINLYVDVDHKDPEFHTNFSRNVDKVTDRYTKDFERLFQFGNSYGRRNIAENILSDQARIVPLACAVLIITIIIALRNIGSGLMPMITAGSSVVWTFGFMAMVDIPLNVLTVIVPSILLVIGSTEDLHMMHEYLEGIEETGGNRVGSIEMMAGKLGLAVFMTSLTTVIGFASIIYNDISMLVQFGVVATFALIVNPLSTFTFGPALLGLFGPTKVRKHEAKKAIIDRIFHGIAEGTLQLVNHRRRKVVIVVTLSLITLIMLAATSLVEVNNDFIAYFKKDSEIRQRSDTLHVELAGAQTFFIRIDSGKPGTFKQSRALSEVAALQTFMAKKGWFDKTESLADRVALLHREMNNSDPKFFSIPADSNLIAQYLLLFQRDEVSRFVTHDYSAVNILVRHNVTSSAEINRVLTELSAYIERSLDKNFKAEFTGEYILINKAAESLAINSVTSLALTLFVVFMCMYFLFWSFKAGLISLVPNIFPIIFTYGVMGLFNIPLNVGTAMVADIAIGIAVDDTIHFMTRYNRAMRELQDREAAVAVAVRDEVRPVVCSSFALAGGFAICAVSNFVPVIQFGLLSAMVMLVAIVSELLITPILLQSTQLITLWDMIGLKLQEAVIKASPFFEGLRPWQRKKVCLLGKMVERAAGTKAVAQGEYGKSMYLLLEGKADVVGTDAKTGRQITFATLNPGDIFGEIALVQPGPRSADILAREPIKYLEIDWEGLKRIQSLHPRIGGKLFLNLSRILGQRLINANSMIFEKA